MKINENQFQTYSRIGEIQWELVRINENQGLDLFKIQWELIPDLFENHQESVRIIENWWESLRIIKNWQESLRINENQFRLIWKSTRINSRLIQESMRINSILIQESSRISENWQESLRISKNHWESWESLTIRL